jgi:hypothetical protein
MSIAGTAVTESDILSHALETIDRTNWSQVAHVFSELKLPARDLDRVDRLLEKNRAGSLPAPERAELEKYLRVGNFLDLIRARALRELGQTIQP